jgi:hypothetical protein
VRKVSDLKELEQRIDELEKLREVQKEELKADFRGLAHDLSPAVLIRKGVKQIVEQPGLKATAMDTAIGSGLGFLGRKLIIGKSGNFLRKIAGTAVQFVVSNLVRNKMPAMRSKTARPKHPGEL